MGRRPVRHAGPRAIAWAGPPKGPARPRSAREPRANRGVITPNVTPAAATRWLATFASALIITGAAPATTAHDDGASTTQLTAEQAAIIEAVFAPEPPLPGLYPPHRSTWSAWAAGAAAAAAEAATPKRPTTAPVKKTAKKVVPKPAVAKKATAPARAVTAPSGSRVNTVVGYALAQVGKPYKWGAAGPGSFDCSGLTMAAFARVGIRLPHQSGGQASAGRAVTRAQLQRGDLILYPGHVAVALGGGKMVHAANPRTGIVVASIYGNPTGYRRLL